MGIGSSVMLRINIEKVLKNLGIDGTVDSCTAGVAKGQAQQCDVIVAPVVRDFGKPIIELKNMVGTKELTEKIQAYMEERGES
jgi:PTS system ascorbate-specific IIB component